MPDAVRITREVPEGELRVYWEGSDESTGIHAWGPRSDARVAGDLFGAKPWELGDDFASNYHAIDSKAVVQGKPFVDVLRERGYDPTTLVFSVMKAGVPRPAPAGGEVATLLAMAEASLKSLKTAVAAGEEAKEVRVFSDEDMDEIADRIEEIESLLERAVDAAGARA